MFFRLLLLFTVVPFVELALLIKVGTVIGTFETLALIILTGMIGALMVRAAGIQCLMSIRNNMRSGIVPTDDLLAGLLILVAGAFLVTPGLITDAAGFLLLVPQARTLLTFRMKQYLRKKVAEHNAGSGIDIRFQ